MDSDEYMSTVLGDEKRDDIIHVEEEDTRSETSGVVSASDVESALSELDDIRCVPSHVDPLPVTAFTNLTCSHGTTNLKHSLKIVVVPDVAFVT